MRNFSFLIIIFYSLSAFPYFYPQNYEESRFTFKETVIDLKQTVAPNLSEITLRVPSQTDAHLTIDGLYIPQQNKNQERLFIITSGVHGVEAFAGAALQIEFLKKQVTTEFLESTALLVLHSVNPYGFHFLRRVNENNVDLNRNFSATPKHFSSRLPDYASFESFINPKTPLSMGWWSDLKLFTKSIVKLIRLGRKKMAQTSVGGQYQSPKGIYFGGQKSQDNTELVKQIFYNFGKDYNKILHIDLHTGYGQRGELHFFSSQRAAKLPGFSEIFRGFDIDKGSDDNFYETSGSFDSLTMALFRNKDIAIPMTFEFGTMNSQTILGGFFSLRNLVFENQGFHHGYADQSSEKKIKKDFLDMFNPPDKEWRDQMITKGSKNLEVISQRFREI